MTRKVSSLASLLLMMMPAMGQAVIPLGTAPSPDSLGHYARPVDDTQLKQVIIFGRHSVRAPVLANSVLDTFSAQPFPPFPVDAGILTPNGAALETILGGYYRLWLTKEGLLTGNDAADASFSYFRANVIERTLVTAKAFGSACSRRPR